MKFQLGAMSVGDILDRGFKVLMSRIGTFYAINLLMLLPLIVLVAAIPFLMAAAGPAGLAIGILLAVTLFIILLQVASGATLHVIAQEYLDRRVTVGQAVQFAFGKIGQLFVTSLLAGLMMMAIPFLAVLLIVAGAASGTGTLMFLAVPVLLVGIVMGIVLALRYSLCSQVVVVEDIAGMPALSRSSQLGTGFRGRIFGILFLIGVLSGIVSGVINAALDLPFPQGGQAVVTPTGLQVTPMNSVNLAIHQVVAQFVNILFSSYLAICLTLIYFDLRVRKEGFDLELAATKASDVAEPI